MNKDTLVNSNEGEGPKPQIGHVGWSPDYKMAQTPLDAVEKMKPSFYDVLGILPKPLSEPDIETILSQTKSQLAEALVELSNFKAEVKHWEGAHDIWEKELAQALKERDEAREERDRPATLEAAEILDKYLTLQNAHRVAETEILRMGELAEEWAGKCRAQEVRADKAEARAQESEAREVAAVNTLEALLDLDHVIDKFGGKIINLYSLPATYCERLRLFILESRVKPAAISHLQSIGGQE